MKNKYILIGIVSLVILLLIVVGVVLFIDHYKKVEIKNIERLYFSYTQGYAMNASVSYELNCEDECILVYKEYGVALEDAKKYEVDESVLSEIEGLFNKYEITEWNGFKKSNKYVLDGDSFTFTLVFDGGKRVEANGYMSWPKNYEKIKKNLENIFTGIV